MAVEFHEQADEGEILGRDMRVEALVVCVAETRERGRAQPRVEAIQDNKHVPLVLVVHLEQQLGDGVRGEVLVLKRDLDKI